MSKEHIRVAISLGDYNGIGPEVILKALSNPRITEFCTPVVYASSKVIAFYKKLLGLHDMHFHFAKGPEQIHHKKINLLLCWEEETNITPGEPSAEAGNYAFRSLEAAVNDLKEGRMDILVTAPLDKSTVNTPERPFSGHTGYLAETDEAASHMMILVCDELRVGLVTGHLPLKEVAAQLTRERVVESLKTLNQSLKKDFGITKPRIAVLGLNPHAGDQGLLGKEEEEIIVPAIEDVNADGLYVFGPYPSDGFFGSGQYRKFDAVLAMYHDQGLIPFKLLGFENGVNYTAGLSYIRTSPDHGTAYAIAGKGVALEDSFRNALYLAIDLHRRRHQIEAMESDPLAYTPLRRERFRMDF